MKFNFKSFIIGLSFSAVIVGSALGGALADRIFVFRPLDVLTKRASQSVGVERINQKVFTEESAVIAVAEKVSPSVVTVSVQTPTRRILEFNPFGGGISSRIEGGTPRDIGSGFIISKDGLIVTNKHVVSVEGAKYTVITSDNKEYAVQEVNKDPANDLAIIKIDADNLQPAELGDSSNLKVGQFVIAIGTALGEFRHTVTTGVISGLGRGIIAGSVFEGYIERLDDVIQTDAAINPGNSGGPLLNSAGQVIGINIAIAQGAQNIGFVLPINVIKEGLREFEASGKFAPRPFLGVSYQMISRESALLNNVPQGAYVLDVVSGSSAEKAGVKPEDIIIELDGEKILSDPEGLSRLISKHKPGDEIGIKVWRNGETLDFKTTLSEANE